MMFGSRCCRLLGKPGAITPQNIHTFPILTARAFRLAHVLYGLYDAFQYLSELQDLPYGIETSGDDCSAWRQ